VIPVTELRSVLVGELEVVEDPDELSCPVFKDGFCVSGEVPAELNVMLGGN
jgi:hypothetical protein